MTSLLLVLQASLAAQVRGSPTSVHLVSPGMVATDLLAASARSVLCCAQCSALAIMCECQGASQPQERRCSRMCAAMG